MDKDVTQEQIRPARLDPIDAYNHALVQFSHEFTDLARAIEDHDTELAGVSANDAVGEWIAADAACKRLARDLGKAHSLVEAAHFGLTERRHALLTTLEEAETKFTNPRLRNRLKYLRQTLGIAR